MAEAELSRSGRLVEEWQIKEAAEKVPEYEVKTTTATSNSDFEASQGL